MNENQEACLRETEGQRFIFLQNFSGKPQSVPLPNGCTTLEGEPIARVDLEPFDSATICG